jgi:site-specific recombinase XerD
MSGQEVRQMISVLKHLRHRLILGLLYGCGLRSHELCNLRLEDVDLNRGLLHVREGKGRKDRYLPLGSMLVRGIKSYIDHEGPVDYLFNGKSRTPHFSALTPRGVNWAVREARRLSRQKKKITAHSFRHTYATHLLEMGLDIVQVKDLLGHAHLQTTILYLHTSRLSTRSVFSPLDKLYEKR